MRRHPAAGARMLRSLGAPETILPLVLHHHERWDGAGYPTGRRGDDIPLEARVLCVADSFDAMTSTRPYRTPLGAGRRARGARALRGIAVRPRPGRGVRRRLGRCRPRRPRLAGSRRELKPDVTLTAS